MKWIYGLGICLISFCSSLSAQEWQWMTVLDSVISNENNDHPHAFLWIPPNCKSVRAVVVGQHNMIEEGILEHSIFRNQLSKLGIAEIWITPCLDITFDFNKKVGKRFDEMMQSLADISGYTELAKAPIIPIGHSALASYPWNFAAWNPERTLALISIHGDAPQTNLTGSGRPNPDWGNKNIDGVPALFVMGEYEWWENRIAPGFEYIKRHPASTISFLADAGHGHFDYSDELISYLAIFIKKAAAYRLLKLNKANNTFELKPLNPGTGWLMDRWHKDSLPNAKANPYQLYAGNRSEASWTFDEDMCKKTEQYYVNARAKQKLNIGIQQNGFFIKPAGGLADINLKFNPLADGISFSVKAFFTDSSRMKSTDVAGLTPPIITRICGPVKKIDDSTFRLSFYRMGFNNPKRSNDIWLLASHKGDKKYKSAVQQMNLRFPLFNKEGRPQQISFPIIEDQKAGTKSISLHASSDARLPVYYYIKEGPAEIKGNTLYFTQVPKKAKFPIKVTVVAWQYGNNTEPEIQSAKSVEQVFYLKK